MNQKARKLIENIQLNKPKLWFKIINNWRLMYNGLCRPCKILVVGKCRRNKFASINPEVLCVNCKDKTIDRLNDVNDLIREGQQ